MISRSFNNKFEEKRFMNHLMDNRYDKILILWGAATLVEIVEWYQHIELYQEAANAIKYLKGFSEKSY